MGRPSIPAEIKRKVLTESGHRCAIPTCKSTPVELAHIVPWSKCKEHKFSNLIALCPTCHTRFDKGEISKKEMEIYKNNLSILNNRYGDLEQRVLLYFAKSPEFNAIWLPGGLDIMLMYLVEDGMIIDTGKNKGVIMAGMPSEKLYGLTEKGRQFISDWLDAKEID